MYVDYVENFMGRTFTYYVEDIRGEINTEYVENFLWKYILNNSEPFVVEMYNVENFIRKKVSCVPHMIILHVYVFTSLHSARTFVPGLHVCL